MLYAHITFDENGYSVIYSVDFKMKDFGKSRLVDILFEETSNIELLDKTVAKWKEAHEVKILRGFADLGRAAREPEANEHIDMLRKEIHRLSRFLESEAPEKKELLSKIRARDASIYDLKMLVRHMQKDIETLELELQKSDFTDEIDRYLYVAPEGDDKIKIH